MKGASTAQEWAWGDFEEAHFGCLTGAMAVLVGGGRPPSSAAPGHSAQ